MSYELIPSKYFLRQLNKLDKETLNLISRKLEMLVVNPFRNKKIVYHGFLLFRIRFTDRRKEKRSVYFVKDNIVKIVCILDRSSDYKDLKDYLKRF